MNEDSFNENNNNNYNQNIKENINKTSFISLIEK